MYILIKYVDVEGVYERLSKRQFSLAHQKWDMQQQNRWKTASVTKEAID